MRRGLKTDLCEMRNRIAAALRHCLDLLKDQAVTIARERRVRDKNRKKNPSRQSLHGGISNHQNAIWQCQTLVIRSEVEELDMTTTNAAATVRACCVSQKWMARETILS
jgi:hypothetical protein